MIIGSIGAEAGQTVPHAHFHIIPREPKVDRDGDGEMWAKVHERGLKL